MRAYRVIQWATGVVGTAALKGVLRHPRMQVIVSAMRLDDETLQEMGLHPTGDTANAPP